MQTNWAEFTGVTELAKQDLRMTNEKFGLTLEKRQGRNLNVYKRQFQEGKERKEISYECKLLQGRFRPDNTRYFLGGWQSKHASHFWTLVLFNSVFRTIK